MSTLNLNLLEAAKKSDELLNNPINILGKTLEEKLEGSYGKFVKDNAPYGMDQHLHFPGHLFIDSMDEKRNMSIRILFNWDNFRKEKEKEKEEVLFILLTKRGHKTERKNIKVKSLDAQECIENLKAWLHGEKEMDEIPWKKWEKEQ